MSPEIIRVILRDWYNGQAKVTLTLRSGQQFSGMVASSNWDNLSKSEGLVTLVQHPTANVRHDVDITEIAAITAEAST